MLDEINYPTANDLAEKIAEKNAWTISPTGESALNQVGLSTQVSVVCEFISDGPYREYEYFNKTIKFKHTSNRNISTFSKPLSLLIQSIKELGENNISKKDIQIMTSFYNKYIEEDIIKDTKSVPAWIYEVLKKIKEESIRE